MKLQLVLLYWSPFLYFQVSFGETFHKIVTKFFCMFNVGILPTPSQKETLYFSQESICSFTVNDLWI